MKRPCTTLFLLLIFNTGFGQKTAQFKAQILDSDISIGYGLAIGDVDGDGAQDILLADKKQFAWYRNGDWKKFIMLEDLTQRDNVCIAAQDINGDGKCEVAVGAQWNPGETENHDESGSIHYLVRPEDPTQEWEAIALHHVPTIHRMRWVKMGRKKYELVVLPLHGIGNKGGQGAGVQVLSFKASKKAASRWKYHVLDQSMHMTHNFEHIASDGSGSTMWIGGKEGIKRMSSVNGKWASDITHIIKEYGFGELRIGKGGEGKRFIAGIEPMHGNMLTTYDAKGAHRQILAEDLKQGHALACADLLGMGQDQIIVGWRSPNSDAKVGIRMYIPQADGSWQMHIIDDNGIACEDLKIADLNNDGKAEIIACGRASKNVKIYWNQN